MEKPNLNILSDCRLKFKKQLQANKDKQRTNTKQNKVCKYSQVSVIKRKQNKRVLKGDIWEVCI